MEMTTATQGLTGLHTRESGWEAQIHDETAVVPGEPGRCVVDGMPHASDLSAMVSGSGSSLMMLLTMTFICSLQTSGIPRSLNQCTLNTAC